MPDRRPAPGPAAVSLAAHAVDPAAVYRTIFGTDPPPRPMAPPAAGTVRYRPPALPPPPAGFAPLPALYTRGASRGR